jgi:hypothetical protein
MRAAPLSRSLQLELNWKPNRSVWGATWSFLCGLLVAASSAPLAGLQSLTQVLLAWFVCVPLWGQIWTGLADGAALPDLRSDQKFEDRVTALMGAFGSGRTWTLALALAAAYSLEARAILPLLLVLLLWMAPPLLSGKASSSVGWSRSIAEIWLPGVFVWLVLTDGAPNPSTLQLALGKLASLSLWWRSHGSLPLLLFGFAIIYHSAVAGDRAGGYGLRRMEAVFGYVVVIAILAVAGSALAAALVGMLFALQWTFQAGLLRGHGDWYYRATQGPAMLAMLIAAIGLAAAA